MCGEKVFQADREWSMQQPRAGARLTHLRNKREFGWSRVSEGQGRGDKVNVIKGGDQMEKCLEMARLEGLGAEE